MHSDTPQANAERWAADLHQLLQKTHPDWTFRVDLLRPPVYDREHRVTEAIFGIRFSSLPDIPEQGFGARVEVEWVPVELLASRIDEQIRELELTLNCDLDRDR